MSPQMPEAPAWPAPRPVPSTDGVTLASYELPGSGRDAVLVHANGFCAAVFAPLAAALRPWNCIAFDARAHGGSDGPEGDMAWNGHRDDVLVMIDHSSADRPIGIGHSMGGAALLLAEQARPGTFAGLWLFEPIVFPPMPDALDADGDSNPLAEGALRRRHTFENPRAAFDNYRSKPPLDELSAECLAAYVTYGFTPTGHHDEITLACRPADEAAGYRMGNRHSAWDHLTEVDCPVVVARGADSSPGPATIAPAVATRLPRGNLEEHPELGHFGPLAAPEVAAASITRLAERVDGTNDG